MLSSLNKGNPTVAGMPLRPLSLRTLAWLESKENRFVTGGEKREADVINFIWYHWKKPKPEKLSEAAFAAREHGRIWEAVTKYGYNLTIVEIDAYIKQVIGLIPIPCSSEENSRPSQMSLETSICAMVGHFLHWPPSETMDMPLDQVAEALHWAYRSSGIRLLFTIAELWERARKRREEPDNTAEEWETVYNRRGRPMCRPKKRK